MIKVTVWEEYEQSRDSADVRSVYPDGIHECIAAFLKKDGAFTVRTATLHEPEDGLPQSVLDDTDVLLWWAHVAHDKVSDETVKRIRERVLKGMGVIFLHSAHMSKPFTSLMGTSGALKWRDGDKEILWTIAPQHPILEGVGDCVVLDEEEMYGEFFDIAPPEEVLLISWFSGGEVFRSLCTWNRGYGKVVYFRPGHETNPSYHHPDIQKIITNATRWAYSPKKLDAITCPHAAPMV